MADSYNELFGKGTHSADADLLAYYDHASISATTVMADASGNGNDGTHSRNIDIDSGSNAWYNTIRYGSGSGSEFPTSFAGKTNVTVMAFADPNTSVDGAVVAQFSNTSTERDWLLWWDVGGANAGYAGSVTVGSTIRAIGTDNADSSGWSHAALTVSSGSDGLAVYVNGVETARNGDTTYRLSSPTSTAAPTIGFNRSSGTTGTTRIFKGDIGPTAFFDRVLAESEIAQAANGPEPLNISAPSVTGTHETGETLSSSTGSWDSQSNGTITYTYQWQTATDASGTGLADISGATSSSFTLTASQEGLYVRCLVRGSNDGGHDAAEDTGSVFTLASAGGGGGPSSTGFPFVIYYRGAACV